MQAATLKDLRDKLLATRRSLEEGLAANPEAEGVVELDQTRQGRVSRVDALQQQAMAQASHASARQQIAAIDKALERIATGHYGDCEECGEPISVARLAARPEARQCIDCQAAGEAS